MQYPAPSGASRGNPAECSLSGRGPARWRTPEEKRNTKIINGSRRKRIAMGSGTKVQEVNKLLKQFDEMKKMMKKMSNMKQLNKKGKKGKGGFKLPFFR